MKTFLTLFAIFALLSGLHHSYNGLVILEPQDYAEVLFGFVEVMIGAGFLSFIYLKTD